MVLSVMKKYIVDVTELVDQIYLMIAVADRMAEKQPYPRVIKRVRDKAFACARKARDAMEPS